ncbi:hypothetical protein FNV43_RR15990 [Rhamnella rubrinervis]|uniref:Two-component response regulator-like APRR7 n=1 Tax=Rhamnella rubrinervis TaxID=2594499 RepID=A0A8K0GX79_9ROSA|nr:hypothetical protein FNV43_RR15990 [Rhamnella rubrinervis]
MSVDGDGGEDFPELNHHRQDRKREVKDKVAIEDQRLVEETELKNTQIARDNVKDEREEVVLQIPQQQPQGPMVCWERFLNLRSLKVLLVENDDSTRHVVTALLRNCSYEVIVAANGLQAWKVLEDLTNHVDLVLTEVIMPCVSGVALLSKIMSHKTRKNLPVIMMSSHDSMGIVFKCLSKGAVDFLVKPIRKNELKNLWQHVWRRCHSSSGSGSESGTHTQKSVKSKNVEKSDNNSESNDEEENESIGLNVGDGSDNGSGTQSSWTKQAVEVDSSQLVSHWDQRVECPDSTCAQVVHSNAETCGNKFIPVDTRRDSLEPKEQVDIVAAGKDLEIGMPDKLTVQLEFQKEDPTQLTGRKNNLLEMGSSKFNEQIKGHVDCHCDSPSSKLKCETPKWTNAVTNVTDTQMGDREFETSNRHSKVLDIKNKAINVTEEIASLELSLKRLRGVKDTGTAIQDDRNVLRRSDSSAFSRYNATSNANKAPSRNVGSSCPHDNCIEVAKKEHQDIQSHSSGNPPNNNSNGASNNIDMGSTTNNAFSESFILNKSAAAAAAASTVQHMHPSSAFHPVKNDLSCAPQQIMDNGDDVTVGIVLAQSKVAHKEHQIQHLHHHYDHHQVHPHLVHRIQRQQSLDNDDFSLKKLAAPAPHCGSSNVLGGPAEGNTGNYSIIGSASGSNHGSNGQNGSSTAINVGGTNIESDNGIAGKSGSGDGSGSGSGNRIDDNKSAQREAALTKFRQKRKERCFRKKVRYQSRKRLAEQRPRVRGQFVRQPTSENTSTGTDS